MKIERFEFNGAPLRVVQVDGAPQWIAKDVCDVLDLENVTRALEGLDADELSIAQVVDTAGRMQEMRTVTEAGLYTLILRSRKPEAKEFRRWVTHELLPDIRRKGYYVREGDESRVRDVLDRILRHRDNKANWQLTWRRDAVALLAPLYGYDATGNQFPVWMASIIHRLYNELFGVDVMDEARDRRGPHTGKGNLLTQYFTDDAKEYLRTHIDVVMALAKTSRAPEDFWAKVAAVFGRDMMQLPMLGDGPACHSCGFDVGEGHRFCGHCGARA